MMKNTRKLRTKLLQGVHRTSPRCHVCVNVFQTTRKLQTKLLQGVHKTSSKPVLETSLKKVCMHKKMKSRRRRFEDVSMPYEIDLLRIFLQSSWRRLQYVICVKVFKTTRQLQTKLFTGRPQDVFKTSPGDVLKNLMKTFWRRNFLAVVLETSPRCLVRKWWRPQENYERNCYRASRRRLQNFKINRDIWRLKLELCLHYFLKLAHKQIVFREITHLSTVRSFQS